MKKQKFRAPTPKVGVQRLLRLAKYMKTVKPREFNQTTWGFKDGCGTAMCIAGHATRLVRELTFVRGPNPIKNLRTKSRGNDAFADAFALENEESWSLTAAGAAHQTPTAASAAVARMARDLARWNGLKIHRDGRVTKAER